MPRHQVRAPLSSLFTEQKLAAALREKWQEGYSLKDLRADILSGIVVALVAIPLAMALAIASGVAPQHGLYTVIIAGSVIAFLGGSRLQVSGPTAAFVVILAPIVNKFGFSGLLVAGFIAGLLLVLMGVSSMGRIIQYIPYPVTTGFTAGIALVIATLQLKDFFGLTVTSMPDSFIEKFITLINAAPTVNFSELAVGISTLCILTLWPKWSQKIPAPLVALSAMGLMTYTLTHLFPQLQVATIGSRFQYVIQGVIGHGIPQLLPRLDWPWNFHDPSEIGFSLNFASLESIVPSAFAIATLGAIESLLSAVIADAMAQTRHDPNAELIALGIGNILCPFFGAVPATGALARTATNIRYGARSPISAVVHALFTLLVVLLLAPVLSYVPMASLAALLLLVAYNMSELRRFNYIVRVAPRSDVLVLLLCFSLTVLFDMVIGVSVGVVLAALLFMRRMAEVTNTQLVAGPTADPKLSQSIPAGVMVYQIHGPLFFGAADRAVSAIMDIHEQIRAVVYILNNVPVMDVSGLVALESAIKRIGTRKVVLVGLQAQPLELLTKSGFLQDNTQIQVVETLDQALTKLGRGARGQFGLPETNIATPDANKTLPGKQ